MNYKKIIFALVFFIAIPSWADDVQISSLVPFNLGTLNPFRVGDAETDQNVCIYSSTGYYTVKITDVYNTDFVVRPTGKPTAKAIAYQVFWNTSPQTAGNFQLPSNQVSDVLGGASATTNCQGGETANIQIKIPTAEFSGAYAGQYTPSIKVEITAAPAP